MLREVKDGRFEAVGLWPLRRWSFAAGRVRSGAPVGRGRLGVLLERQTTTPVALHDAGARRYWIYGDRFWWEDEGLEPEDVRALVEDRVRRNRRRLEQAHAELARAGAAARRSPLPRSLRRAIFERDGGHCTECGSSFELQYDHVIPVALGGASTEENLQLLCADCNRRKGTAL